MDSEQKTDAIKPECAAALRLTLIQQLPAFVLSALMLDSGRTLRLCMIAILGFWLFAMLCLARGHRKSDPVGLMFLRWGFFPLLVVLGVLNEYIGPSFHR